MLSAIRGVRIGGARHLTVSRAAATAAVEDEWKALSSAQAPEQLAREVRRRLCGRGGTRHGVSNGSSGSSALPTPAAAAAAHAVAEACHARRGLSAFPLSSVCGIVDALARQSIVHRGLMAEAMAVMQGATRRCSPQAVRSWIQALITTRTPIPSSHLDECLAALGRPHRGGKAWPRGGVAAPAMLRFLLLAEVAAPSGSTEPVLKHMAGYSGSLLSAHTRAVNTNTKDERWAAVGAEFTRHAALNDIAWLLEKRPPAWWQPLAPHHEAVLEIARQRPSVTADAATGLGPAAAAPGIEKAVRAALRRLRCEPVADIQSGGHKLTLALPELRLALECIGTLGEIRVVDSIDDFGEDALPLSGGLHPLVELRHARLRDGGWGVEVIRDFEWPVALKGEDETAVHRREELLLRQKLAGALQRRVPPRRRHRQAALKALV
eukprot:TRINITY_DN76419_c0_g1_i1.p1 TRINITY_DN76419_c0_g1~~TRINITY_DN76419_c0_g1_i1.p1  ORF type:complete len:463 (+),score=72.23 TRINITY_DN76419_c0_g1_i1:83-1390(+)